MPTAKQIQANRRNAQKSTGPTSPAGRATVSQNAVRHGLAGSFRVLPCESQEMYDRFLNQLIEDEKPVGLAEVELVKKMAEHTWLAKRALRFQERMFVVSEQTPEHKAADGFEVGIRPELERFIRYHTTHDRAYQRASKELRERQKERRLAEIGFAREKRAQAEETRRAEVHVHKVKAAKAHAERAQADATMHSIAAADKLYTAVGPELAAQAFAEGGLQPVRV
jgi:hypothetical protein